MIAMNRPYKMVMIIVSIVAIMSLSVGITNELKRRQLIDFNKHIVASIAAEIDAYKNLGFSEEDRVIEVTKSRLAFAQENLEAIKSNRNVIFKDTTKVAKKDRLETLLKINKEMADNYRKEIEQYMHLGVSDRNPAMKNAKNNLVSLVVEIAELENKLKSVDSGATIDGTLVQKVASLIALNKESLELYKKELEEYTHLGVAQKDTKVQFVRTCITNKAAEIEALERHLQ